jgi:hypothetical protein
MTPLERVWRHAQAFSEKLLALGMSFWNAKALLSAVGSASSTLAGGRRPCDTDAEAQVAATLRALFFDALVA